MAFTRDIPPAQHDLLLTLTGSQQFFDGDRKFQGQQYDAMHEAAAKLKKMLMSYFRSQNRERRHGLAMVTPEQRALIRRVIKPMERSADLHMESAKHDALAYKNLLEFFGNPQAKRPANAFNPHK